MIEAPDPILRPGWVRVANRCSLISAGTERSKVILGAKSLVFVSAQRLESTGQRQPPPWIQYGDPDMEKQLLYAYDKKTGALLRTVLLDGLSAGSARVWRSLPVATS